MRLSPGWSVAAANLMNRILVGDVTKRLRELPDESVQCVVTSPPYWGLRDYGVTAQIGLELTPQKYVRRMVKVFKEVARVLRKDGTLWLNIGDSYSGSWGNYVAEGSTSAKALDKRRKDKYGTFRPHAADSPGMKPKDLCGIPWTLALALRAEGLYLRSDIIWAKPNGMPGSQDDRPTSSHEYIFLLTKAERYWSDFDAIKTPPRESSMIRMAQDVQGQAGSHRANGGAKTNGTMKAVRASDKQRGHSRRHDGFNDRWDAMEKSEQQSSPAMIRDVWFVSPAQFSEAHFAVMPDEIARRCILAGCPEETTVLDPFAGSGTTGLVAMRYRRNFIGIELNPEYAAMAERRITNDAPMFNKVRLS